MEPASILVEIYGNIDLFLLATVRMIGFFIILPVFTGQNVPTAAKITVAAGVALITSMGGQLERPLYDENVMGLFILMLQEFLTGFIIGFAVYLLFTIFYFVGQLIDYQIGFSMVSVYDPVSQIQAPITGNLYYLIMCAFFVMSGGLHRFVHAMCESYRIVPIGGAKILANSSLMFLMVNMMIEYLIIGVQIALPIVGTIIIVDVALGVLVKAAPQMNIFVVGMPIKVFVGIIVLFLMIPTVSNVYAYLYELLVSYTSNILQGMAP